MASLRSELGLRRWRDARNGTPKLVLQRASIFLGGGELIGLWWKLAHLDLSRFRAAPSARLSHFPFESDGAFPAQC